MPVWQKKKYRQFALPVLKSYDFQILKVTIVHLQ